MEDKLASVIWRHQKGTYYGSRHLGGDNVHESQCNCGEWFPSGQHHKHVAEKIREFQRENREWR